MSRPSASASASSGRPGDAITKPSRNAATRPAHRPTAGGPPHDPDRHTLDRPNRLGVARATVHLRAMADRVQPLPTLAPDRPLAAHPRHLGLRSTLSIARSVAVVLGRPVETGGGLG